MASPVQEGVLIGREREMEVLSSALLSTPAIEARAAVCAIHGVTGAGKSALVEHFGRVHASAFPGGTIRLSLIGEDRPDDRTLATKLTNLLRLRTGELEPIAVVRERLLRPRALLHIDDVHSREAMRAAMALVKRLDGCTVAVSGRSQWLGVGAGWTRVEVGTLSTDEALALLEAEGIGARNEGERDAQRELSQAALGLPLGLRLVAGLLRAGRAPGELLERIRGEWAREEQAPVEAVDAQKRTELVLRTLLALSLDRMREALGPLGERGVAGLESLGHAPPGGVGRSLAAAMAGLEESELDTLAAEAAALGLVEPRAGGDVPGADGIRMHPFVSGLLFLRGDRTVVLQRMTGWFLARMHNRPAERDHHPTGWREVHAESEALVAWLAEVPVAAAADVHDAAESYATSNGPFDAWMAFYDRVLPEAHDARLRRRILQSLSHLAYLAGDTGRASAAVSELESLQQESQGTHETALVYETIARLQQNRGEHVKAIATRLLEVLPRLQSNAHSYAVILTEVASSLSIAGMHQEAMYVLREVLLPTFSGAASARQKAIVQMQIADILQHRGQYREALRIYRDDVLPIFERIQDLRGRLAAISAIGDVLMVQGDSEAALDLYRDALSEADRIGDVLGRAASLNRIAHALSHRGEIDKALDIHRNEVIPIYDRTGAEHEKARTLISIGNILVRKGRLDDARRAYEDALAVYDRNGSQVDRAAIVVGLGQIHEGRGEPDLALERYREAAVLHEDSGNLHQWAIAVINEARMLHATGRTEDALRTITDARVSQALDAAGDVHGKLKLDLVAAQIHQKRGEHETALEIYERARPASASLDERTRAAIAVSVGDAQLALHQVAQALHNFRDVALPVFDKLGSPLERALVRHRIAVVLCRQGNLDEGLHLLREEVAPTLRDLRNISALAASLRDLARILHARGAFADALEICEGHLLPLLEETQEPRGRTAALFVLAEAHLACMDTAAAFRIIEQEVSPLIESLQDSPARAKALHYRARAHLDCGELDQALNARRKQVAELERLQQPHTSAEATIQLARVHLAHLELDQAHALLEEIVLPALHGPADLDSRALALAVLADIHLTASNLDDALRIARDEHLPLAERLGDVQVLIAARHRLARVLLRRGHPGDREEACRHLDLALADAERLGLEIRHALRRMRRSLLLERVSIQGFKNIARLNLSFTHDSELPGRWTCIAGINGAGKSAVLQGIALVLLGTQRAPDLRSGLLQRLRRRVNGHTEDALLQATVYHGAELRTLELKLGAQGIDQAEAVSAPAYKQMKEVWDEREQSHVLVAYGPGRNLSERIKTDYQDLHVDVQRQITLFDPLADVASAEALLDHRERRGPFLGLLKRLLALVLKDTPLSIAPDRDGLRFRMNGVSVPASDLPDGFRAVVAWLADLCAAWCEKAPDEARDGDPTRIRAIVLIDEIDLHLHPSLQRVLVPRLRRALPDVQWIVTTHSPLVLSSFDRRELVLLDAQSEGGVRTLDRQILGWSMDEVYSWLMETEPRSGALDERPIDEDLALVLAQSPEVSERKARENQELRRKLIERLKKRDAEKGEP